MAFRKIILLIFLLLICTFTNGQVKIKGIVISELTGEKPEGTVYARELETGQLSVDTDSLGIFEIEYLEPEKEYAIEISAFGYDTQTFNVTTGNGITTKNFVLKLNCNYSTEKAESDWKIGKAKILLVGSIVPIANTKKDKKFEKKYNIKYLDFGCTPPSSDCIKLYNKRIFELMNKTYGSKWRDDVRKDAEFLYN